MLPLMWPLLDLLQQQLLQPLQVLLQHWLLLHAGVRGCCCCLRLLLLHLLLCMLQHALLPLLLPPLLLQLLHPFLCAFDRGFKLPVVLQLLCVHLLQLLLQLLTLQGDLVGAGLHSLPRKLDGSPLIR